MKFQMFIFHLRGYIYFLCSCSKITKSAMEFSPFSRQYNHFIFVVTWNSMSCFIITEKIWQITFSINGSTFLSHDLHLLEALEFKQRIKHIVEIIEEVKWQDVDPDTLTRFLEIVLLVGAQFSFNFYCIVYFCYCFSWWERRKILKQRIRFLPYENTSRLLTWVNNYTKQKDKFKLPFLQHSRFASEFS